MKDIRSACISFRPEVGKTEANLKRMTELTLSAKAENAELVLFGELSLTGYTTKASEEIAIGRDTF